MRVHGLCCSKASASYSVRCQPQHTVAGERFHWSREEKRLISASASVEPALYFVCRAWFILAASARAWRCAQRTERNGVFGFQTKKKDRFLNQRRWTCWYSCGKKHASPVSDSQFSYTFLFVFVLKSLLSLLFTSRYAMEAFLVFYYYYLFDYSIIIKNN